MRVTKTEEALIGIVRRLGWTFDRDRDLAWWARTIAPLESQIDAERELERVETWVMDQRSRPKGGKEWKSWRSGLSRWLQKAASDATKPVNGRPHAAPSSQAAEVRQAIEAACTQRRPPGYRFHPDDRLNTAITAGVASECGTNGIAGAPNDYAWRQAVDRAARVAVEHLGGA